MQFEITPEDIKHVSFFEPQKAAVQLTQIMQMKVAKCLGFEMECEHTAELKIPPGKLIDEPSKLAFPAKPAFYVCTKCGKVLEPIGFK